MTRPHFPRWIVEVAAFIVAGLVLGVAASLAWVSMTARSPREPAATGVSPPTGGPAQPERQRIVRPDLAANSGGKRALLIGVTRYDNLSKGHHLAGPANDVRLMRRLLQERYGFPADGIVGLSEDEGSPARRPTRENIEREFRRLADRAREGDQVVVLLAGHGARQPESNPPDPVQPEPDGIDEIFLPADVSEWRGYPERVPRAIVDNEIGAWLRAITAKRAYVWAIFDCCHSGTMTRGTEVVREMPPGTLVPREELDRARERAARRQPGRTRGGSPAKPIAFVPPEPSDFLVATYACRSDESTPEGLEPQGSPEGEAHGLLTYSLVEVLARSANSKEALTYRELVRRLQAQYAGRPQGSPTPMVEGRGQDRIVLGIEEPTRSPLVLTREKGQYRVNAGDLYGLTAGSVLAVETPAGADGKRKLLGHVRVRTTRPFDATVESCEYEGTPPASFLPPLSTCRPVYIDYALRRFKVAIQAPRAEAGPRRRIEEALKSLARAQGGLVEPIDDPRGADWIVRLDQGRFELVEASGNRPPFPLPSESPALESALRSNLEKVFRARNLVGLAGRFEGERSRGSQAVDVEVEVLRHRDRTAPGEAFPAPAGGYVFRPGDLISFRVHNRSPALKVDVTLLVVGSDFQINAFYPRADEVGKSLGPGETLTTPPPPGEISEDPPFGPESLVVIAAPATNPPVDFSALAQGGLQGVRAADVNKHLRSPLGELLESAMFRTGSRGGLNRSVADRHGLRVLTWRTQPR